VCVLELALHHGGVDLDYDDTAEADEDHARYVVSRARRGIDMLWRNLTFDDPIGLSGTWS